jgi:glucan phosphoethanolaminetransferase (alkaline phosphatase superfamily)
VLFLQVFTLVPCFSPHALYRPHIIDFQYPAGLIVFVATTIICSNLVVNLIRAIRSVNIMQRWFRSFVGIVFTGSSLALLGSAEFYSRFGTYPRPAIIFDFVAAPAAFIAYTRSGTSGSDVFVFCAAAIVSILMIVSLMRSVWFEQTASGMSVGKVLIAATALWGLQHLPAQSGGREFRFQLMEHSLPATKYAFELANVFSSNEVEAARGFIPRGVLGPQQSTAPKARHVLLIIAECLRADHLPAYGYSRNTTPFIQSESEKWLSFTHAYAHGSRTADSFPVMFNSRYFAAVDGGNAGASAFWHELRGVGIGSAFLSAGAMEWGGIVHALDLTDVDYELIASSVDPRNQKRITSAPFDYAVDDAVPLRRYIGLLENEFSVRPSFASVHFVGSHYPFQYDDTPDTFVPSMRIPTDDPSNAAPSERRVEAYGRATEVTESGIQRVANSYDNSIVHIDQLVRQCVEALERIGIADDSVIILTADHGESLGEHQTFFHGTTLYEEQVHVPFMVRVGAHLEPIRSLLAPKVAHVVGQVDLMPTILELLEGRTPEIKSFDGMSLLSGRIKSYELLLFRGIGEQLAFVTDDSKFIFDVPGQRAERYSLTADPNELHNLWTGGERSATQFVTTLSREQVVHAVR